MGRSRAEIESDISACEAKIEELEAILEKLKAYKDQLATDHTDLNDNVKTPVDEYDFEENNDWAGFNKNNTDIRHGTANSYISYYEGEVTDLEGDIANAIEVVSEMIETEKNRLTELNNELDNCESVNSTTTTSTTS
ncbi:MAG: DUF5082 domain-containing protein [Butyrivibrio sp.]|uniref:YwqH-like family protein n=1 Tax=Butyrivibrio sp. TaxID=28121 RepID=UPI0025DB4037|nr:DUF5082 family protein [Butyrivibrio sp.]MCR5772071.1 DUF5082 domain-containing protein [Butyrivibrio sp.]